MTAEQLAAIATAISAVAACFSWRAAAAANKISQRSRMPILRGYFDRKRDLLIVRNYGDGPALNIHLQRNTMHYTNTKRSYEFKVDVNVASSIMPSEEKVLQLNLEPVSRKAPRDFDTNFSTYEFFFKMAKRKYAAIIFRDIHGASYLAFMKHRLGSKGELMLDFIKVRRYTIFDRAWDDISTAMFRFYVPRRIREWKS